MDFDYTVATNTSFNEAVDGVEKETKAAGFAVLQADIKIGLRLPCKINVYVKGGQTFISGMRPIILPQFFPEAELGILPEEVDKIIRRIIEKSK